MSTKKGEGSASLRESFGQLAFLPTYGPAPLNLNLSSQLVERALTGLVCALSGQGFHERARSALGGKASAVLGKPRCPAPL